MDNNDNYIEKITPQNIDAERAILGAFLLDKQALEKCIDTITRDDFYVPSHQFIFDQIKILSTRHFPIDLVSITDQLAKVKILDDIGGYGYLLELTESVPTTANIEGYIAIIREKHIRRKLLDAANLIIKKAYDSSEDIIKIVDESQTIILDINKMSVSDDMKHLSEFLYEEERLTGEAKDNGLIEAIELIKTGSSSIDEALGGGLNPSDLIVLAARPGMGKSAMVTNIAVGIAKQNKSVGFISLEMPGRQIAQRIISAESEIGLYHIKNRIINDKDYDNYLENIAKLSKLPFFIDDLGYLDVNNLKTKARKLKRQCDKPNKRDGEVYPLGALIIDYLQIMDLESDDYVKSLGKITKACKKLAIELNIPVIALSQLSRDVEKRQNKRPILSDLRDSGSLEQDADIVAFIYRDEYYNPETTKSRIAELIIPKFRNGLTGTYELYFDGEISKFSSLEKI